jgi:hypothetical protein
LTDDRRKFFITFWHCQKEAKRLKNDASTVFSGQSAIVRSIVPNQIRDLNVKIELILLFIVLMDELVGLTKCTADRSFCRDFTKLSGIRRSRLFFCGNGKEMNIIRRKEFVKKESEIHSSAVPLSRPNNP